MVINMMATSASSDESVVTSILVPPSFDIPPESETKTPEPGPAAGLLNTPDDNNNIKMEAPPKEAAAVQVVEDKPKIEKKTKFLLEEEVVEENSNENETESVVEVPVEVKPPPPKEVWTSYSRNFGNVQEGDPSTLPQIPTNSKLGHFLDALKSMTDDNYAGFNLHNFIVAGILSNMKTLGVEEFECKEYVEHWLTQRRQRRWKSTLDKPLCLFKRQLDDTQSFIPQGNFCERKSSTDELGVSALNRDHRSDTLTVFSPSKPNSSLMRLTGDGNVKLGQFLGKMEEVRCNINNATCNVLQSMVVLTLPYMKLLSGTQLESVCFHKFCKEWTEIVALLGETLKHDTSYNAGSASLMLDREFRSLRKESSRLLKRIENLYRKVSKISRDSLTQADPAVKRLQPKNLPRFRGRRVAEQNKAGTNPPPGINATIEQRPTPEPVSVISLSPIPLDRINLDPSGIFSNHILFTKSKKGHLVYKYRINDEWKRFSELTYQHKRELFLHAVDDLHTIIKQGFSISGHIKELFIDGYPESILVKIRESLKYLKEVSKETELLVVSKVTITKQVKLFQEAMGRLVKTLENAKLIGKCLAKSIQACVRKASQTEKLRWKHKPQISLTQHGVPSRFPVHQWQDWDATMSLRFDNSKVRLLIPYLSSDKCTLDEIDAPSLM